MKEQVDRFLEHAEDALDDANYLLQDGRILALANRSYYDLTLAYLKQNLVSQ